MPYLFIVIILAFAVFFFRAAELEDESGFLWSMLSVLVSVLTWFVFHWGWLGGVLGQAGLFAGITIFRMLRKP